KRCLNMVAQLTNAEASTFYVVNSETSTSYTVNAKVSISYTIMIDQVANIESSTFYTFTAEAITSGTVNAEFSTSYVVNVQPNSSYTIDTETNALCKNAVYDEATTEEFGGKYVPKKSININTHRNRQSKRKGCEWHINLSLPKKSNHIIVTTFVNTHNHELDPKKCKYNTKFRSIGDEALNDIEFYTKNRNLLITIQRQLLRAKYTNTTFLDMDLTNAIQYYKVKSKYLKNNASQLLLYLTEKCSEESVAQALVSDKTVDSYLWILQCTMKATGIEPMVFVMDADLAMDSALKQTLYPSHYSWACAFTSKVFTAGIQTTSRVEGYNNIIKRVLCDLVKTLDSQLEKEAEWNRFFEYQTLSSCVGIVSVSSEILLAVDHILLEYLIPQILSIEHIEMAQYLYFDATLVDLTVIGLDDENENINASEAQQGQKIPLIPQPFTVSRSIAISN
ncbi:14021_t:CDS:2, partial [Racocetra persica]